MPWNPLAEVPPCLESAGVNAIGICLCKFSFTELYSKSHYLHLHAHLYILCSVIVLM